MNNASVIVQETASNFKIHEVKKLVVSQVEGIESLKPLLKELQLKLDCQNILIDPDFYQKSLELGLDSQLASNGLCAPYLAIYLRDGEPIAALVARRYPRRQPLRFGYLSLSTPPLDCLEVEIGGLLALNSDAARWLAQDLLNLLQSRSVDCINFKHVRQESLFYPLLFEALLPNEPTVVNPFNEWLTLIADPETGEPLNLKKTGKSGKRERALERKLLNRFDGAIRIETFANSEAIRTFLADADLIAQKSYQYAANIGIQDTPEWHSELNLMLEMGCFRGYMLYGNDQPIAYNFGVAYGDRFTGYAMSFDPEYRQFSPGVYLLKKVQETLANEGIHTFHFGYGDAEYKKRFAVVCISGETMRLYGRHFLPYSLYQLDRLSVFVNSRLKDILQRLGLFNAIKRLWRSQLKR